MLSSYATAYIPVFNTQFTILTLLTLTYFALKHFLQHYKETILPEVMLSALLITGIAQAVYGNLQLYGIFRSNHPLFNITGSFGNPGPYAGFLAMIFPFALGYYLFNSIDAHKPVKKTFIEIINKYLSITACLTILLVIPSTRSRAAWLALAAGSLWMLNLRYRWLTIFSNCDTEKVSFLQTLKNRIKLKRVFLLFIAFIFFIIILLFALTRFKKDSASGRLLIWEISTRMIIDKPLFGHGYSLFIHDYNNAQAVYFATHPNQPEKERVAGFSEYAFNDYLQTAVETGILGVVFLVGILAIGIIGSVKTQSSFPQIEPSFASEQKETNHFEKYALFGGGSLVSLVVFMLFSYPLSVLPIQILFVFMLAVVGAFGKIKEFRFNFFTIKPFLLRVIWIFLSLLAISLVVYLSPKVFAKYQSFKEYKYAYNMQQNQNYENAAELYEIIYPEFADDGIFLQNYGKVLALCSKYEKSIEILEMTKKNYSDFILYTTLGDNYKQIKQFDKSKEAYNQAINMEIGKLYPKYLMVKLFEETGRKDKAVELAKIIIAMNIKIESAAISEIKTEMRNIIKKN